MSSWTEKLWEWLQSWIGQPYDCAYRSFLRELDLESSQDVDTAAATSLPQEIYSDISLSQWLPSAAQPADAADGLPAYDGLTAYEVEQTERSAFESFLQGYSLF